MKVRIYTADGNIDFENADWYIGEDSVIVHRAGEKKMVIANFYRVKIYGVATIEE